MPKSSGQKLKLLYLMKIFMEETDEFHPLSRRQITDVLERRYDIVTERKTFYDDMECLRLFGLEIESVMENGTKYFLASRTFEMPELRLLADAVGCSQFITEKKSRQLIAKLATLCSCYQGQSLRSQIDVATRNKTVNETIYYSIDAIYTAKSEAKPISFFYFNWVPGKDNRPVKEYRHQKARYLVTPLTVVWKEEKYYLIAFDSKSGQIRHYRIDKMENLSIEKPLDTPVPENFNANEYTAKLFNMYGGKEEQIMLRFNKSLLGVMVDQFGSNLQLRPDGENSLILLAEVVVSSQFLGWLFSLEDGVEIVEPKELRSEIYQKIKQLENKYR